MKPEAPTYEVKADPLQQQADVQAKADQLAALQERLKGDTASIMTRYGAMLTSGSTATAPATSSTTSPSGEMPSVAAAAAAFAGNPMQPFLSGAFKELGLK